MAFKDLDELLDGVSLPEEQERERSRILVVDDDPLIRRSLGSLLREDYHVTVAASAQEGVEAVDEDTCAVILDVKMKGYDGFWACTEIRKRFPEVPIIFYSAYQDLKDPYAVINEHRPFGYLTKGGGVGQLLETLEAAVRLHRVTLYNKRLVGRLLRGRRSGP